MRKFTVSMKWNERLDRWLYKESHYERWNFPDCEFTHKLFEDLDKTKINMYTMIVSKNTGDKEESGNQEVTSNQKEGTHEEAIRNFVNDDIPDSVRCSIR